MARKVITLEIEAEDEDLIRGYASFVGEMKDLAATTPDGSVLDVCEEAVIEQAATTSVGSSNAPSGLGSSTPKKKGSAEKVFVWTGSRESRDRHARGLHLPGGDLLEAALVGLAMPLRAGRLSRRCRARARRRPQPSIATQGLPQCRRPVVRADPREPARAARRLAGGRDPAGLLRASGRPDRPLAGHRDRLGRGLPKGPRRLGVHRRRRQGQHPREGLARPEDRRGPEAADGRAGHARPVGFTPTAGRHGPGDVGRHLGVPSDSAGPGTPG